MSNFPGESSEYRRARNELLEAEAELRRVNEQVAAQRRALPAGGLIKEDYVFESAADGSKVRFSELFAPGKNSLVIYNKMFPRWSEDLRAGAPAGKTAELPLVEQPCPSCTSVVDGLEGAAFHLAERINLVVIAKTSPDRLGTYAQERGWRNLRLAVLREQPLQPELPCGSAGRRTAPGPERVLTRRGRDPPPLGERDDVQARRHQLPRPGLGNLRRSRFDARGTRRQRCLPQPAVLGSPRILARFRSGGPATGRSHSEPGMAVRTCSACGVAIRAAGGKSAGSGMSFDLFRGVLPSSAEISFTSD